MARGLSRNAVPVQVLGVACAEPLALTDLLARLDRRGVFVPESTVSTAAHNLRKRGLLAVAGQRQGMQGRANLYILTPAGEALLDRLWRPA